MLQRCHHPANQFVLAVPFAVGGCRDAQRPQPGAPDHVRHDAVDVAVLRRERRTEIADVAVCGSDVEIRNPERADVVHLARMYEPDERVAHHHHVQIGRRQRRCQPLQRLIRQRHDVLQPVLGGKALDLLEFAAAAGEAERDVLAAGQAPRGFEQGRQRMTRAVIARIHHDVLAVQPVVPPKPFPSH